MYELISSRKYNQTFNGYAQAASFTFSLGPEQLPGTSLLVSKITDHLVGKLAEQGSKLLEIYVYEDAAPTWRTDYIINVMASVPENRVYSSARIAGLPALVWAAIAAGSIAIGTIFFFLTVREIGGTVRYVAEKAPGSLPMLTSGFLAFGLAALVGVVLIAKKGVKKYVS